MLHDLFCVSRSRMHGLTRESILYLWGLEQYLLRELNFELILFTLALVLPALSSLFFSTLLVFIFPSSFQLFFFSFTFSILLILSFSLLYSFHVVSLSALARSLIVIVDIGSLDKELNLEFILFILALIPPALSVGMGSLEKELNLELILFLLALIPHALSPLFLPTLLVYILPFSFQLSCFSFTFSILLILALSSLLVSCSLFKCNCPKFNCNSWYRISWEGH